MTMRFLIAESETTDEREQRRANVGRSAAESYAVTLSEIEARAMCEIVAPADEDARTYTPDELAAFDAVFLTGSPLHVYDETPETKRHLAFMRAVFASGTPSFGSCAGLQVAVAAAGGRVRAMDRREVGLARRITATQAGRDHPLLAGRGPAWDAPTIHGDEVEALPDGGVLLATSAKTRVQAVEIVHDGGTFWGVQYHPELSLAEIAAALRRDADAVVEAGLALTSDQVEAEAALFDALDTRPDRIDVQWRLGVDNEVAEQARRRTELVNFIRHLVEPTRLRRGR